MPGRPSTTSEIESPTGCTKQLMSVACSCTPAAEFMRPAGMKPSFWACRKRRSQWARRSSLSAWARARATRRRTSSMLASLPFAYFSSSVSRQISCAGAEMTAVSIFLSYWITIQYWVARGAARRGRKLSRLRRRFLLFGGRRGSLGLRLAPRVLQEVGDRGVAHAKRQLDRGIAFARGDAGIGAVAQQHLDHRRVALHRRIRERRIAVVVMQVQVEVHRQHLLGVDQVVLFDRVEEGAHAFRALFFGPRLKAGGQQLDEVVDGAHADQGEQRQDDRCA